MAELDDYRWLVSDAARPWLERVRELAGNAAGGVQLLARLRKDLSAGRAHLVVEQAELRERAREKFVLALQMFFTRKALEQATDRRIAEHKARRFAEGATVADLCCGIGGDLLALAARGPVTGVDSDPIAALLAQANARVAAEGVGSLWRGDAVHHAKPNSAIDSRPPQVGDVQVIAADATAFDLASVEAWHIDPDRRPQGRRTTRIELVQPPLDVIEQMIGRCGNAAIKLAPAAEAPVAWADAAEREWLGSRGECRQQVAWFGTLARHAGRRSATIVDAADGPRTIVGQAAASLPVAPSLGRFVYEPHAAVLAAKLAGALCGEHQLAAVSPANAYLTGDNERAASDPALDAFEVREVLSLDRKQLKSWCRAHRVGRLEIKKRDVAIDPERLRKEIVARGDEQATLLIAPIGGKARVVVADRSRGPGVGGRESSSPTSPSPQP